MSDTGKYAVTDDDIQRAEHEVSLIVLRMRARKDEQAIDKKALDEAADRLAELKADARAGQMRIDVGTGEVSTPMPTHIGIDASRPGTAALVPLVATGAPYIVHGKPWPPEPEPKEGVDLSTIAGFTAAAVAIAGDHEHSAAWAEPRVSNWLDTQGCDGEAPEARERIYKMIPTRTKRAWLAALDQDRVGEDGRIRAEAAGVGAT